MAMVLSREVAARAQSGVLFGNLSAYLPTCLFVPVSIYLSIYLLSGTPKLTPALDTANGER